MRSIVTPLVSCIVSLLPIFSFAQIDYKGSSQWSWHQEDSTEYYLYIPSGMHPGERYPVALFMHGCCGVNDSASLRNAVDPPVRMWHNFGANTQKVPTYIIAPATSRGWERHFDDLKKVMDELVTTQQGDPQRIYVCGFSMGGDGTFKFISRYPRYFAAAIIMGMELKGDLEKIKDVPLWVNRGETDWYSRNMHQQVAALRKMNGAMEDTGFVWATGINPRFSSFNGIGHGVQWKAASTQPLTDWAYSKINDGNRYPNVWFKSPQWKTTVKKGTDVQVDIGANDPDGSINKIEVRINGRPFKIMERPPFLFSFTPGDGDNTIEATVYDDKGKTNTATTIIKTNIPASFITPELPYARQGALYTKQLFSNGNGQMLYSLPGTALPVGLTLTVDGLIKGIPVATGEFGIPVRVSDEDGDTATIQYRLKVLDKRPGEVVVTQAMNDSGVVFPVSKISRGELPFFNRGDDEINFSETGAYEGLTYIPGNNNDTVRTSENYLQFNTDENATVYVAYERLDNLYQSTIPKWLKSFTKQPASQMVAQYFYYDVYYKAFPAGKIALPGADEKRNGVNTNYFVMIAPIVPMRTTPEINIIHLNTGNVNTAYHDQLTALYGKGEIEWTVKKGTLPAGITLLPNGALLGAAGKKGAFRFTVEAKDANDEVAQQELTMLIK
ncbi:MAG TPA: putative Ig domain-containing protein [Agriterribacter sp.]|nr:putative Ig domain-containing protein [Agriterribacter sp.]